MSEGLGWYIAILSVANLLAMAWLIWWSGKGGVQKHAKGEEMGHVWDGDLKEYNNPLPRWWLWLFYGTIIFALIYLALYPGLGIISGALGWTQQKQYQEEIAKAQAKYGPIFEQYASQDLAALAADPEARKTGRRIFLNYCATCHGSDAGGGNGFPNLTDEAWLHGGSGEAIKKTIMYGVNAPNLSAADAGKTRATQMPALGAALGGDEGVAQMVEYVRGLGGLEHDADKAAKGKQKWSMCAACHGANGKGNPVLGAPNLTDQSWLHGSSRGSIRQTLMQGRKGVMPAHGPILGEDKVHLVAAYVKSLGSN